MLMVALVLLCLRCWQSRSCCASELVESASLRLCPLHTKHALGHAQSQHFQSSLQSKPVRLRVIVSVSKPRPCASCCSTDRCLGHIAPRAHIPRNYSIAHFIYICHNIF